MPFTNDPDRKTYLAANPKRFVPAALLDRNPGAWTAFAIYRGLMLFRVMAAQQDVDSDAVKNQLQKDVVTADAFITAELGTGAGSLGARVPSHLDLQDSCRSSSGAKASDVTNLVTEAKKFRIKTVRTIALRALALHPELWTEAQNSYAILQPALREIIDRRLRVVEMMKYHVNSVGAPGIRWDVSKDAANNPVWKDGNRNRLFEYPTHGSEPSLAQLIPKATAIGANGSAFRGPQDTTLPRDWKVELGPAGKPHSVTWDHQAPYPEAPVPGQDADPSVDAINVRLPTPGLRRQWKLSRNDRYTLRFFALQGGLTLAQAIDAMFALRGNGSDLKANFWDRSWLNCDHVIAALKIEALLFGWRRRAAAQADVPAIEAAFNGLEARNTTALAGTLPPIEDKYVWLGAMPLKGMSIAGDEGMGSSSGLLDGRSGNAHFRTHKKELDQLEIGDHVIFWNNGAYDLLSDGLWRLENAVVTELTEDKQGAIDTKALRLGGHGLTGDLAAYAKEMAGTMNVVLLNAVRAIQTALIAQPTKTDVQTSRFRAIKWAPYPGLLPGAPRSDTDIGTWWVVVPISGIDTARNEDRTLSDVAKAVVSLPGSVGVERTSPTGYRIAMGTRPDAYSALTLRQIGTGTGFTSFETAFPDVPIAQNVLFPLVQPLMKGDQNLSAWIRYFEARSTAPIASKPLGRMLVDSTLIPGLTSRSGRIWSTYPKPRPAP